IFVLLPPPGRGGRVHVEAVPAAAACNLEARRLARLAKAGRQEPAVHLLDRVVSVAGAAAREGLTAKRGRPEMAPQRLEEVGFVPGNGMALSALDTQDLVLGAHEPGGSRQQNRRVRHSLPLLRGRVREGGRAAF